MRRKLTKTEDGTLFPKQVRFDKRNLKFLIMVLVTLLFETDKCFGPGNVFQNHNKKCFRLYNGIDGFVDVSDTLHDIDNYLIEDHEKLKFLINRINCASQFQNVHVFQNK